MEFATLFYLMVFILSYVENLLEQRRSRNYAQTNLSSSCTPTSPSNRIRTPSPNELPYYDSATGRLSGPALDLSNQSPQPQKITRMTIDTTGDATTKWPPSDSQTTFECYARGNQWVCAPTEETTEQGNWDDSHESVPHCLHGQDKVEVPRIRHTSKESLDYNEPSHHRLYPPR